MSNEPNDRGHWARLLAFEGLDASGKSTQISMLLEWLGVCGVASEYISFPRLQERGYGEAIAMFLRGEFGPIDKVHPYVVASLFAGDRAVAAPTIRGALEQGKIVLADRYFYSNLAFQSAKLPDIEAKKRFSEWIHFVEFESHGIPRPDLTVYFDVPFEFITQRIQARAHEERRYLNGRADIHEASLTLQRAVAAEYSRFQMTDDRFITISCANTAGEMLDAQTIHRNVITILSTMAIIPAQVIKCP